VKKNCVAEGRRTQRRMSFFPYPGYGEELPGRGPPEKNRGRRYPHSKMWITSHTKFIEKVIHKRIIKGQKKSLVTAGISKKKQRKERLGSGVGGTPNKN